MHPHDGDEEEDDDEQDQAGADESGDVQDAKKHENDSDDHHGERLSLMPSLTGSGIPPRERGICASRSCCPIFPQCASCVARVC
jgi:hypothetical protein